MNFVIIKCDRLRIYWYYQYHHNHQYQYYNFIITIIIIITSIISNITLITTYDCFYFPIHYYFYPMQVARIPFKSRTLN
jgi:hypothetical protein